MWITAILRSAYGLRVSGQPPRATRRPGAYSSTCVVVLPFAVRAIWENAESGVAPCQCFSSDGMCTTSPGVMTCCSVSVAMMPLPAVTNSTWSLLWVCILFRAPGLKLTMPRLKLLLTSGCSSVCRVTGPPVNKGAFTGTAGISAGLCTFMVASSLQAMVLSPFPGEVYSHPGIPATQHLAHVESHEIVIELFALLLLSPLQRLNVLAHFVNLGLLLIELAHVAIVQLRVL